LNRESRQTVFPSCLRLAAVLLVIILQTARSAPTIDWAAVHATTMRGIDHFYRLETDAAIQAFDSVSRMAPGDPRGPFFLGMVHFSLYMLDKNQRDHDAFLDASERTIAACEQLLDQNEHDASAKFYLGGIYGYRGLLLQQEGSLVKAAYEGRRAYVLLEEAVEERPDLYDAQMGFGLFRYLVTKAPRSLHWILKLVGITPDEQGGLQSLRLAAENGVYARNEARLYLAQFLMNEHRQDEAMGYINALCNEYPENALFLILRASFAQRTGNPDAGLEDALEALRRNEHRPLRYVQEIGCNTLGGIYFARSDFAAARKYYAMFPDSLRTREWTTNWLLYRYAVSCELTGDRARAVAICSSVRKSSDDLRPYERYYYRRSQELVTRPLSKAEDLLLRAGNAAGTKNHLASLQLADQAARLAGDDPDVLGRALLVMMQAQYELKEYSDAVELAPRIVALKPRRETWVLPHAYFKLGQALAQLNRKDEARKAFSMVGEYDDYDFQERLERNVDEESENLSR
jgi:tetratricopeptide (TPR) repeat protein